VTCCGAERGLLEGVEGAPAEDLAEMSSLWEAGISESEILQVE